MTTPADEVNRLIELLKTALLEEVEEDLGTLEEATLEKFKGAYRVDLLVNCLESRKRDDKMVNIHVSMTAAEAGALRKILDAQIKLDYAEVQFHIGGAMSELRAESIDEVVNRHGRRTN